MYVLLIVGTEIVVAVFCAFAAMAVVEWLRGRKGLSVSEAFFVRCLSWLVFAFLFLLVFGVLK